MIFVFFFFLEPFIKARRRLRALRGFVRLKSLVEGNAVKRQAGNTLRCMQTWARVQSQIRSRRIRMIEENQALQRQLQLIRERELERSKVYSMKPYKGYCLTSARHTTVI